MKKLIVSVPVKMMEAAQTKEIKEKPYNLCHHCPAFRKWCDGPDCFAMLYLRWCEWVNDLIALYGLTRSIVAEEANLPLSTVHSVLSGKAKDVKLSTAAAITKAVHPRNGEQACWGEYACFFAYLLMNGDFIEVEDIDAVREQTKEIREQLDAAQAELESLREQVKTARERREAAVAKAEEDAQKKIDFLREQIAFKEKTILDSRKMMIGKDKTIKILGILIGALGAVLLGLLIADAVIPGMGWFRY